VIGSNPPIPTKIDIMKGIKLNIVGEISNETKEKFNKLIINKDKKLEIMRNLTINIKKKKKR